jgi:ubiquinone/menaquinone biosynthesis C-methylase UbiE
MEAIYNKRAPAYDNESGFHPTQAADYIKWMDLQPGQRVLDLACGTGAITIPAANLVGPSGKTIGVDISGDSLTIARSKSEREIVNATFFQHDIAALDELDELEEGTFDVISCASAFVLFEDPGNIVKGWAKLLKIGGKMIFDVPTWNSMVGGYLLNVVGHKLNMPVAYDRTKVDSVQKIKALLIEAALDERETFVSESYNDKELDAKDAGEIFEDIVSKKGWFEDVYAGFRDPNKKPIAKEMFCQETKKLAENNGKMLEEMRFIIAVGKKV